MSQIDQIALNFNPASLVVLNLVLALVMFGVSLDLRVSAFERIIKDPKGPVIGLICQFLLLPAITFGLIKIVNPHPSIALGMILVAACPGGNISNIMTHLSKGNTALSVSMTAVSTAIAVFATPFNITFWGSMDPGTASILREIDLNPLMLFGNVVLVLGIPLVLGMWIAYKFPGAAYRMLKPFKYFSITFFLLFVLGALSANYDNFINYVGIVAGVVLIHNALALSTGYFTSRLLGLPAADRRAVAIEVGIQNSGLGLTLIFSFFDGLGGMALIAAWWGVWHVVSGLTMSFIWSRFKLPEQDTAAQTT